jgi:hypothetical protein
MSRFGGLEGEEAGPIGSAGTAGLTPPSVGIDAELSLFCYIVADNYDTGDLAYCFKLTIWDLQCKYANLVDKYANKLKFGENCKDLFVTLKTFKRGLEVLNNYNVLDIEGDTKNYNSLSFDTMKNIIQKLYSY